ncbi:MAG TPA: hypothetical protein VM324_06160 [Egibacteraceae bacterium]|nr:hypothetical protein [Egibacteraceae bacterium]
MTCAEIARTGHVGINGDRPAVGEWNALQGVVNTVADLSLRGLAQGCHASALPSGGLDALPLKEHQAEYEYPKEQNDEEWEYEGELDGGCAALAVVSTPPLHVRTHLRGW